MESFGQINPNLRKADTAQSQSQSQLSLSLPVSGLQLFSSNTDNINSTSNNKANANNYDNHKNSNDMRISNTVEDDIKYDNNVQLCAYCGFEERFLGNQFVMVRYVCDILFS